MVRFVVSRALLLATAAVFVVCCLLSAVFCFAFDMMGYYAAWYTLPLETPAVLALMVML